MPRLHLASVALLVVAAFGSTGCYSAHYGRARYGCHMRMRHAMWVPRMGMQAPPPPVVAAPQPAYPAYPAYSAGPQPIVVHTNPAATTVIIINPATAGQPTVQYLPAAPAPQRAPAPQPAQAPEENPNGWFQEE